MAAVRYGTFDLCEDSVYMSVCVRCSIFYATIRTDGAGSNFFSNRFLRLGCSEGTYVHQIQDAVHLIFTVHNYTLTLFLAFCSHYHIQPFYLHIKPWFNL